MEQINNFQTLSLRDFPAVNLEPFLSIDDDYYYHTDHPRRPEVSSERSSPLICHPRHIGGLVKSGFFLFSNHQVGDVRVRFSFAGLSGETSHLGPPQTVSVSDEMTQQVDSSVSLG